MLILTRQTDETIVIGHGQQLWVTGPLGALVPVEPIAVTLLGTRAGGKARIGIDADPRVSVHRQEICRYIDAEIEEREAQRDPAATASALAG